MFNKSIFSCVQFRSVSLVPRTAAASIKEALGKPKSHTNAYSVFFKEKYPQLQKEFPSFGVVDIAKRLGNSWKSLSEAEKKAYTDKAAKLSAGVSAEIEKYNEGMTKNMKMARRALYYNRLYSTGQVARSEIPKEIRAFVSNLPALPFISGRNMYMASQLRGHGKNVPSMMADVHKGWDRLSAAEKQAFEDRAKADVNMYKDALRKFLQSQ